MQMLHFKKMNALGNDFVVFDGINQTVSIGKDAAKAIADREKGIGCDQVLIVRPDHSSKEIFDFQIFNHDGSESSQCGNGARCVAQYLYDAGHTSSSKLWLKTKADTLECTINRDSDVTVGLGVPEFEPRKIPFLADSQQKQYQIEAGGEVYEIMALSIGNPHAVILVDDVDSAPVERVGSLLEVHSRFPERTNVEFLQIESRTSIRLRVFERGVGETTACGSGSGASVAAGRSLGLLDSSVSVALPGGILHVEWTDPSKPVWLTGPTTYEFSGSWELN